MLTEFILFSDPDRAKELTWPTKPRRSSPPAGSPNPVRTKDPKSTWWTMIPMSTTTRAMLDPEADEVDGQTDTGIEGLY